MSFTIADLNSVTVESIISGIFQKIQGSSQSHKLQVHSIVSKHSSENGKAVLYEIDAKQSVMIANYKLQHEDGQGMILYQLYHLRRLYRRMNNSILEKAKSGCLAEAEALWQQQKNIDIARYTHRLKIIRVKKAEKHLVWLLDIGFNKETSYGSSTAKAVLDTLLNNLIKKPSATPGYRDYLDALVEEDWTKKIEEVASDFYQSHPVPIKVIFGKVSH